MSLLLLYNSGANSPPVITPVTGGSLRHYHPRDYPSDIFAQPHRHRRARRRAAAILLALGIL